MENILKYKDYIGSVSFSADDMVFHGKIVGINDLVTFEAKEVGDLVNSFHEAVNDYIETCKQVGKQPEKTYKGSFNIRVSPELHRDAAITAKEKSVTLNDFVKTAISYAVNNPDVIQNKYAY